MNSCRLDDVLTSFDEHWEPRLVATVNDHDVKVAKIQGAFIWHAHPNSDELFMGRTARCARRSSDFVAAGLRPCA